MAQAKAQLSNYRQSPRKVRLVADMVRGKKVNDALDILEFAPKRAAGPVKKLLSSALSNAKNLSLPTDTLVVKKIEVGAGPTLYRRRPVSRGAAHPIRKRTSHISLTLETNDKQPTTNKRKPKVVGSESSVVS